MKISLALLSVLLVPSIHAKYVVDIEALAAAVKAEEHKRDEAREAGFVAKREEEPTTTETAILYKKEESHPTTTETAILYKKEESYPTTLLIQKREPKNVFSFKDMEMLGDFPDTLKNAKSKREPKNVVSLQELSEDIHDEMISKREAKNVVSLQELSEDIHAEVISKREQQVLADENSSLLQSVLPQMSEISIFAGYIRDDPKIESKTSSSDESMVIIAPSDNAIMTKLDGKKPWEFPTALTGDERKDDGIIQGNLQHFLKSHIVSNFEKQLSSEESDEVVIVTKLLSGDKIKIKQSSLGNFFVAEMDGEWILVDSVKHVDNGFVFVIDEILFAPQ